MCFRLLPRSLQILTILLTDWSIQKICDTMGAKKHMAVMSKSLKENKGVLAAPDQKKGRPLSDNIKSKVIEFYKNDDVSLNVTV
ncbi:Protein of unknown function [Cotesia congregata]|uniref:Uncharacterized protein n=1 Tax=Cotesia congregata TaxID=51543 RepID=A0A8J2HC04_COTCN|nr:Protein of unknown function [Cotesia congregata]